LALPAVAALLAAGLALAALRLRTPDELFRTAYGQLVLAKVCGFVLLLALAGLNRQRLAPALAARDGAATRLSRSVLAEMAVAGLVLCVTTALVRTPPPPGAADHGAAGLEPRPPAAEAADSVAVATEAGGLTALLELSPGRAGPNRIALTLGRASGAVLPPPGEVWAEFEHPAAGVGPLRRRLRSDAGGRFVHDGPELALPGRWSVRIDVLVSDFEQVSLEARVDLRPALP
jgi:copper transport protein